MEKIRFLSFLELCMIIVIGLFIQSCNDSSMGLKADAQNDEVIDTPEPEVPNLVNSNTLSFSNADAFTGFMREISEVPDYELDNYMQQKVSFKSLNKVQNESKLKSGTDGEINDDSVLVVDPYFASILNEDGVVEIDGIIYDVDKEFVYIYKDWDAYNSFDKSTFAIKQKNSGIQTPMKLCPELNTEPQQLTSTVYRVPVIENCEPAAPLPPPPPPSDGGSGSGSGDETADVDYPSKVIQHYRSGGRDGRLKGKSWHVNYYVYTSVGAKSVHARKYTFGAWLRKPADRISLDSRISYSYGESSINLNSLRATLKFDVGHFSTWVVDNLIDRVASLPNGNTIFDTLIDLTTGVEYEIKIYKHDWNKFDLNAKVYRDSYNKTKLNAKTISKVFDWATSPDLINYPPKPPSQSAVKFKIELLRSVHGLTHDGHTLEFITDKRK